MKTMLMKAGQLLRAGNLGLLVGSLSLVVCKAGVHFSVYQWVALLLGTGSIAAAGNVVNDIFDQAIDQVNKAEKCLIGVWITESRAWGLYYGLNALGLGLAFGTQNIAWCLGYVLAIILLYLYSRFLKGSAWWGNWCIAFLCALSFVQLLWMAPEQWSAYWKIALVVYACFAFLTNWWRELIKDIEDAKGDAQNACQTLVVQQGVDYAMKIAHHLCNALLIWLVLVIMLLWEFAPTTAFGYTLLILLPIACYLKWQLGQLTTANIHQFSQFLKGYMLLGLIGVLFL